MSSNTMVHGQLLADTDSWLLANEHVIVLDIGRLPEFDTELEHHLVSVVGTMGNLPTDARVQRLSVEKLVSHTRIRTRAHEIFEVERSGSAVEHWLRAERELLDL